MFFISHTGEFKIILLSVEQFRGAFFHQFAWNLILYQSNLISKRGQQFPGDQLLCEILRSWGVATSFSPLSRLSSLSLSVFLSLLHFLSACRCGEFYRASRLTVFFPFCSATKTNAQHTCTLSLCVCVCTCVWQFITQVLTLTSDLSGDVLLFREQCICLFLKDTDEVYLDIWHALTILLQKKIHLHCVKSTFM